MANNIPHIEYEQIAAYLAGESTLEERLVVESWIEVSDENMAFFNQCRKLFAFDYAEIEQSSEKAGFDVHRAWLKVYSKMDLSDHSQPDLETETDTFSEEIAVEIDTETETVVRTMWETYPWARIAAVLVIGVAAVFFMINRSGNKVNTLAGVDTVEEYYLTDSTKVVLAANTTLTYRNNYGKNNRQVGLKGKAYFDVRRNEDLSFIISTNSGRVEVLGTAFAVEENSDSLYVIVERGTVQLKSMATNESLILERNELGVLNLTTMQLNKSTLKNVNQLYWANKRLSYRQEQLSSVFDDLSGIFVKEIDYDPVKLANCRITGVFMDQTFEEILKNMSISMDFEYSIDNDQVVIISDGCETE